MKRLRCWPHNRVHPTGSTEGTVEIFSLSSFKNDYCSMFRALFKKKKNRNIKQCSSFISCVQIESISLGTALTMKGKMHFKFNIWFMLKSEDGL